MSCTLSQLFALSVGGIVCGGPNSKLMDLDKISAVNFLVANRCYVKGSNYSMAQLVLNKLTPVQVKIELVANLDVCQNHILNLTHKHKSARQKQCGIDTCSKPGERRVSFEQSCSAFLSQGWHILVGSSLCWSHRKLVMNNMTQDKSETELEQHIVGGSNTTQLTRDQSSQYDPSDFHCLKDDPSLVLKRPSFAADLENLDKKPKLDRQVSVGSSAADSQPLVMSQSSTFSSTSEVAEVDKLQKFNQVVSCIAKLDPVLSDSILEPVDLKVKTRTLKR